MAEERLSSYNICQQSLQKLKAKRKSGEKKKKEWNIQGLWHNKKRSSICIMEIPEGEERKKVTKEIFETKRTENFSQLISDNKSQIQEAQRRLMRRNIENYTDAYHFTKKRKSKIEKKS